MSEEPSSLRPTVCAYLLTDTRGKERRRELGVGRGRGGLSSKNNWRGHRRKTSNATGKKAAWRIYSTDLFIWFSLNLIPLLSNLLTLAKIRVLLLYLKTRWLNILFIFLTYGAFLSRSHQGSSRGPTDRMSYRKHSVTPDLIYSSTFESGWPWGTGGHQPFLRSQPRE